MVHPVSTFRWSDVGYRQVGSGCFNSLVGDFVMINRSRSRATSATRPFGPERDLRLLFVLDSWYVARDRTDARRKEIGM
jgi:hypothetical protein